MTPEQYERVRELFLAARETTPAERGAFLRQACAEDAELRTEVESLLANAALADTFLQTPALGQSFALRGPESLAAPSNGVPANSPQPAAHPQQIGQYRILEVIGQGGMGVVYRAEQENPRRTVALKVIRPGAESHEALRRFTHEGQVLGCLQHAGIAQIFEAGTADTGYGPQPYFAMEFVAGRPLAEYAEAERLGVRARLELLAKVCDAVHHAHQKGVVHRDLKPGNILVDETGQPKILDFGVARLTDHDLKATTLQTAVGQIVGTLTYMSPEQITGDPRAVDTRSDIYALGVIGYELLTGQVPVDTRHKTLPEAARAIVETEPRALSSLNRVLRGDVETIISKALEKDKERRYQSASDLATDIRRYLADQPISARPPTTMYHLRKFARRNKPLVAGAVVAFLALVAGVVAATSQAVRATHARNRAVDAEQLAEQRRGTAELRAYVACLVAAQAALSANDVGIARQQLELAPPNLRNWEWLHLQARLDASLLVLREHTGKVWGVAYSPDGRHYASAGVDGTVCVRDANTAAVLRTLRAGNVQFRCLTYSPDSAHLVAGTDQNTVVWWDANTGEQIRTWADHSGIVTDVVFSRDGSRFVSTSLDGTARVRDVESGQTVRALEHPGWVYYAVFSPDATRVFTNCRDNVVRGWDLSTGEIVLTIPVAPQTSNWDFVHSWAITLSPDGKTLVTGGHDGAVRLWDAATGAALVTMPGHAGRIRYLVYSPDAARLASASDDGTIRVWDPAAVTELTTLVGHEGFVQRLAYAPDGSRLLSGSDDRTVRVWDPRITRACATLRGHDNAGVRTLAMAPDGTRIVSGGEDGTVRVWDARSGAGLMMLRGHTGPVYSVAFSSNGALIASAGHDATVRLWEARRGELIATLAGHERPVATVAFTPDGQRLLSASWDGTVRHWDLDALASAQTWVFKGQSLTALAISPDGAQVACGTKSGAVEFRDARTGQEINRVRAHTDAVVGLVYSPDGTRLASASHDKNVVLLDTRTATLLATLSGHTEPVTAAAFSPDGTRLASVSYDRVLRLWDVNTAQPLLSFRAHTDYAFAVAFSPDGSRLASSGKAIRLWETRPPDLETLEQRRLRVAAEELIDRLAAELPDIDAIRTRLANDTTVLPALRPYAEQVISFRAP